MEYETVYVCPVCGEVYSDEAGAYGCLHGHVVEEKSGFVCACGAAFTLNDEDSYLRHVSMCNACEPSCDNCNNYGDGIRHAPCPRRSYSQDMPPCHEYIKIKVALA